MNNNRNQQSEEWRRCQYPFVRHEVSNLGRIRHALTKKLVHPAIANKGYLRFTASVKGKNVATNVHTQVALAFVDGWREGLQVNHKDGNKLNNCAWNLEWVSASENIRHANYVLGKHVRPVVLFTRNGFPEQVFRSASECDRMLGYSVHRAIKDGHLYHGLRPRYITWAQYQMLHHLVSDHGYTLRSAWVELQTDLFLNSNGSPTPTLPTGGGGPAGEG